MKILAIESSCDDTAAAVVADGRLVLSSVVASQVEEHKLYGGVVPEIASRRHIESISKITKIALENANTDITELDAVAVTAAPGLIGSLLVGLNFAKGLALSLNLPLIPVHHLRSHIASLYLSNYNLQPPFIALIVSGGHSNIVEVEEYTDFKTIGKTMDDSAGEAMDKIARAMGIDYPGGANLDIISQNGNPKAFTFPKPNVDGQKYDFSFSGLKTHVVNTIHKAKQRNEKIEAADIGASLMQNVSEILVSKLEMAAKEYGHKKIALCGGVSANSFLRKNAEIMCEKEGFEFFLPELKFCGDNAAMVSSAAYYEFSNKSCAQLYLNARASMKIEEEF